MPPPVRHQTKEEPVSLPVGGAACLISPASTPLPPSVAMDTRVSGGTGGTDAFDLPPPSSQKCTQSADRLMIKADCR